MKRASLAAVLLLLGALSAEAQSPPGPSVPFGPSGAGGGGGGGVASVVGTAGQINCSPTTGNVICGLPSTITESLAFTGSNNYGTPSAIGLINATGLPISTGVAGLGSGVATALGVNVGTAGSVLVNGGVLGTPSSATLTNATGLPIGSGVSGLGTGVATALGNPAGGTGGFALQSSLGSFLPLAGGTMAGDIAMGTHNITGAGTVSATTLTGTLSTAAQPNITSLGTIAGLTVTGSFTATGLVTNADLANSTISGIALGSSLNALTATNGTLTFSGSYNGATARTVGLNLSNANTWAAAQTFPSSDIVMGGSSTGVTTFASANASASNFTITFPAATGTVALTSAANVASVSGTAGQITASPTTGAVVVSLPATITQAETFSAGITVSTSFTATGLVTNADLANSTISGVSLGSNLAALTATDGSLTFSGSYNGAAARTVGCTTATTGQIGCVKPDGTSITITAGVISAVTGGSGTVTSVATNNGVTGGTITSTGTIGLASIATNGALCNNSGVSAAPTTANCTTTGTGNLVMATLPSISGLTVTGSFTATGLVTNADLANSTISGVALGGTLGALTATNATLTLSGSYTGATARTIGLNLANTNTWTAPQTISPSAADPALTLIPNSTSQFNHAGTLLIAGNTNPSPITNDWHTPALIFTPADTLSATVEFQDFGSAAYSSIIHRYAEGTSASPLVPNSGDILGRMVWKPYNGGASSGGYAGVSAFIDSMAEGTITSTSVPTEVRLGTTAVGSTGISNFFVFHQSGAVAFGTGLFPLTDPGNAGELALTYGVSYGGSSSGATLVQASAVASGTLTLPAATTTLAGLGIAQTFSATQTFPDAGTWSSSGIAASALAINGAASSTFNETVNGSGAVILTSGNPGNITGHYNGGPVPAVWGVQYVYTSTPQNRGLGIFIDVSHQNTTASKSATGEDINVSTPSGYTTAVNNLTSISPSVQHAGTGGLTSMTAMTALVSLVSSDTVGKAWAVNGLVNSNSTGTITDGAAINAQTPIGPTTAVTAVFTNISGVEIQDQNPIVSGGGAVTLTNPPAGLRIQSQTASGAFGILQLGSGLNSFAGAATFGTSVAVGAGSAITSSGPGGALTAPAFASFGTASGNVVQGGVITAGGPTGSATVAPVVTYNAAGQLTAVSSATITPAVGSITGLGTGVASALGSAVNGSGGLAPVASPTFTGTITTPDSGTYGSGGINGSNIGATTRGTGAFTTLSANSTANFTGTFQINSNTITWPAAVLTVARIDAAQIFNGTQTFQASGATGGADSFAVSTTTTNTGSQNITMTNDSSVTAILGIVNGSGTSGNLNNIASSIAFRGGGTGGLILNGTAGPVIIAQGGTSKTVNNTITITSPTSIAFNQYTTAGIIVNDTSGNLTSSTAIKPGANNHHSFGGSAPAVTSCGGSPSIDGNASDSSGTVTVGSVATTCTVTFASAYTTFNHCRVVSQSSISGLAYSYTKTAITVTASVLGGDLFDYECDGV